MKPIMAPPNMKTIDISIWTSWEEAVLTEREVVAFLETKRSVDFPHSRDEPASRSWLRRI